MKKKIFILLLTILIISSPISALARAGGGGGGSGGGGGAGGGGGGRSSSSSSSYYGDNGRNNRSNRRVSPLSNIIGIIAISSVIARKKITTRIGVVLNSVKAKQVLRKLKSQGYKWNYKEIDRRVEVVFFRVQEAWANNDIKSAREFVSDNIYDLYNSKIQWMVISNRRNVLDKIKLLEAKPIGVVSFIEEENDFIWFYIRASLIDYTINARTGEIVEGKTGRTRFDEYWKFTWSEHGWVLDEILQTDEVDGKEYFYSSIEEQNKFIR